MDFVKGIDQSDVPQFYVTMDGKPSDRYVKDGKYILVMLIANNINAFSSLGQRVNDELKKVGLKFKKISTIRSKKRRTKYAHAVMDILIEISKQEKGLRYNFKMAIGSAEVMNPSRILKTLEESRYFKDVFNAEVFDNHIVFDHDNKKVKVHHNDFGGMIWWLKNLLDIAAEHNTDKRDMSWWVHMDRLPLDKDLSKTKLFVSMLDWHFKQKLWFSLSGVDLPIDIFPDFFAYIYYDVAFNSKTMDPDLLRKTETLLMLNTKEYWGIK